MLSASSIMKINAAVTPFYSRGGWLRVAAQQLPTHQNQMVGRD